MLQQKGEGRTTSGTASLDEYETETETETEKFPQNNTNRSPSARSDSVSCFGLKDVILPPYLAH